MVDAVLKAASAAMSCSDKLCSLGRAEKHSPCSTLAGLFTPVPETLCEISTPATSKHVLGQKHHQMLQCCALSVAEAWLAQSTDRYIWHLAADCMAHWLHQQ
jgi:hypothetical protein